MTTTTKIEPGPLTYSEGNLLTPKGYAEACWLWDAGDGVVAVVTEGADFERSKVALQRAAQATQVLPDLLAACKAMLPRFEEELNDLAADVQAGGKWTDAARELSRIVEAAHTAIDKAELKPK